MFEVLVRTCVWTVTPIQSMDASGCDEAGLVLAWDSTGCSAWHFAHSPVIGFAIRQSGKEGMGCFVLHACVPGERLLAERPLLEWSKDRGDSTASLAAAVDGLGELLRDAFWDLCQNAEHGMRKHAYGIWLSNALPTEDEPATAAVFRVASRINHGCRPNAHIAWNPRLQRMTLHALTPISAGEEVRIHYRGGGDGETRAERRAALLRDFGFSCTCADMCGASRSKVAASDERQARIAALAARIQATPCPTDCVALVEQRLALMEAEGMVTAWDTMGAAMSYCRFTAQPKAAAQWAARAASCAALALGRDSEEYAMYVMSLRQADS